MPFLHIDYHDFEGIADDIGISRLRASGSPEQGSSLGAED